MSHQKQGTRVRISSHDKVISMSDVHIPNDSICSCIQCDSIDCFHIRNINSGIPCTCTACDLNSCLTWEIKKHEPKPDKETRKIDMSAKISKDSLNVLETKIKCSNRNKKYTENERKKEKISFSYLENNLLNKTSDDSELKEVYTKEEKHISKYGTMKKLLENKNSDEFENKDTSSYENSDIIDVIHLEKKISNDTEIKKVFAKDGSGSDTKICCNKNKTLGFKIYHDLKTQQKLTSNEIKNKQSSSKINIPPNDSKELLMRKVRNSFNKKISIDITKSDSPTPTVYQIFTNEKKNVVKCCNISKNFEEKHADANRQDHQENTRKLSKDSKDVQNNKTTTEINTTIKKTNMKCKYEHPIKEKISDIDYTKYTYKDISHTRNKINSNKTNKSYEKYVSRIQSVAINYARPDYENSRAELSAQIMNVPYEKFKDSLSIKQSLTDSNTCNSSSKIDKIDIFTRLKEIYKACSCKVCECIAGKSLFDRSDVCNCEPCDCDECNGLMSNLQKKINYAPGSGCPCVNCDRKDCRGIVKNTSDFPACDCKPRDCLRCSESFTKPCNCTPCQCETCKTSIFIPQTLLVANAAESFRQSNCDCEPCECTNCTSRYSALTSNLRGEVSTGMITYGNCNCEPCDCDDCNGLMSNLQKKINYAPGSGCPCVNCDRKDCRGIVKNTSDFPACDCKPRDCLRCSESFTKPYNCTPCQYETCKTSKFMPQTLLVANAAESFRQSNCDCDPCECTNCTSRYSAMTSNLRRQVSTGMITYGNCNCEDCSNNACQLRGSECRCDSQHKVIRKPILEKKPDYGIHRVHIKKDKYEKKVSINNRNTITMFALSNNYPNGLFNYSNKLNSCVCDVCECIVCKNNVKGSITNKSLEIEVEKPSSDFNTNSLNNCECSPGACLSCKSFHADNVNGKCFGRIGYDAHNCRNSKPLGYNYNNNDNNESYNLKKAKTTFFTLENNSMLKLREFPECKNLVHSQNSINTDEGSLHDNDEFYHLKRGKVLTPSMFCNGIVSYSSHVHIKPKQDSLGENDLEKKIFTNEQNTKLCRSKSHHNYFDTECEDVINDTIEPAVKVISMNSSLMNMISKELDTSEIFKINSIDFNKGNVSKVFYENSNSSVHNDDCNTKLDGGSTHLTKELSSHCNKIENNIDNKCSQTSLLDKQDAEDIFYNTMSSSNNDIHFSSSKSMSLVKLLCKERNLNIDNKNTKNYLQSLEKISLKSLKMCEENDSFTCKTFNDDIFFDCFVKNNCSYFTNDNLNFIMNQDKLDEFNCENKKLEPDLTHNEFDTHENIIVKTPVSKTIKANKKSNFQVVERKPNNYNIRAKGNFGQPKINKPYSKAKVANESTAVKKTTEDHSKGNVNEVNNKRCLEIPDIINTATSAINFVESDKRIDFEKSFKILREVNFSENKKRSPILRKNFFFSPEVEKNKGMTSTAFELDVKNAVKATSLQTNTRFPYCPGIGFGNVALTKLQTEVNELLYSPLLQSSPTSTPTEKFRSKSKLNSELNSQMSDATSQTRRNNIIVDKEINCDMFESRENLRQSIQNLINTTLTNVVECTDDETGKQNLFRDFNKTSSLNAAKTSYGGLKASFVGLRKVSDHSVLLKWTKPHDLSKIQGYELQVDGRPVKKILNPSRCMAVLTCLPHCEKLLLTIRTLTNTETCHIPVTTIVYKPKKKKTGL